jgi:hypothetical protein
MADSALSKRLGIKAGHRVLLLNAPSGYTGVLDDLPEGSTLSTSVDGVYDVVLAFVHNRADIDRVAAEAMAASKPGGSLWFAYPKKTSKVKTDISRDVGWDALFSAGWEIVAQISIDDTWSAGRFRPSSLVKSTRNKG